jgi:CHASE2 domain-containing sensor protein
MLSREDNRRLAQLERHLRRDDPEFCARMSAGIPRRRVPLGLVLVAVVAWTVALVLAVAAWWIPAAVVGVCAVATMAAAITYRYPPRRRRPRLRRRW